jgi:hypothetical protein
MRSGLRCIGLFYACALFPVVLFCQSPPVPNDAVAAHRAAATAEAKKLENAELQSAKMGKDAIRQSLFVFDLHKLGIAWEELAEYELAINAYKRSSQLGGNNKKISKAVIFDDELGAARALRKLNRADEASRLCRKWKTYIFFHPIEVKHTEKYHWGGKDVAQGTWEYSCGNVYKGLAILNAVMEKECDSSIAWNASLALERYYRSIGDSIKADEIHKTGDKEYSANAGRVLESITSCPKVSAEQNH